MRLQGYFGLYPSSNYCQQISTSSIQCKSRCTVLVFMHDCLSILHLHDSMLLSVSVHWGKSSSVSVYPMRAYMPTGRGLTLEHAAGKHARQTKEHQSTWGHGQTSNRIPMLESRHIVTGFSSSTLIGGDGRRGWTPIQGAALWGQPEGLSVRVNEWPITDFLASL